MKPSDVTHVLITHTHEDHFSGILGDPDGLRFPNALHVLPSADWRSIIVPGIRSPRVPRSSVDGSPCQGGQVEHCSWRAITTSARA